MNTSNAEIEQVRLGFDRGTILTCWLRLDYGGGSVQGYGGYVFDTWDEEEDSRVGVAYGTECIRRLLKTFEVEQWRDLEGQRIRVRYKGDNFGREIQAVGHFMKDQWFSFHELSEGMGLAEKPTYEQEIEEHAQ